MDLEGGAVGLFWRGPSWGKERGYKWGRGELKEASRGHCNGHLTPSVVALKEVSGSFTESCKVLLPSSGVTARGDSERELYRVVRFSSLRQGW